MKVLALTAALLLTCTTSSAWSEENQDPSQNVSPEAAQPSDHGHGPAKPNPVLENMKKIEAMMQQIQRITDPADKRELLARHLTALGEQMRSIKSRQAEMKMGMKEMSKGDGGMMGAGMMMHNKVELRLNILERMLELPAKLRKHL